MFDLLGMRAVVLPRKDLPEAEAEAAAVQACYRLQVRASKAWHFSHSIPATCCVRCVSRCVPRGSITGVPQAAGALKIARAYTASSRLLLAAADIVTAGFCFCVLSVCFCRDLHMHSHS
jgi:hypothetical protein